MRLARWTGGPAWAFTKAPSAAAEGVIRAVRRDGDAAVRRFVLRYDQRLPTPWSYDRTALAAAARGIDPALGRALETAARRIRRVARAQMPVTRRLRDAQGNIFLRSLPVDRAGIYVPGGRYPLLSTVLMGVIPARVAGVREVVVCTPAGATGRVHPGVLAAAGLAGADRLFAVGGAQAIAAMALGTRLVPKVDVIVGPGNRHVAAAKKAVRDLGLCGIDGVAGPSELLAVADDTADPDGIAADLLAQAEHDPDAKVALATPSRRLALAVQAAVRTQLATLPTRAVAAAALRRATFWIVASLDEAARLSEATAPEHLLLWCRGAGRRISAFRSAGTVFVGPHASVAFGDYVNGPNHTLPTDGTARWASGLSVINFLRLSAVQTVSARGAKALGAVAARLAAAEGLEGHRRAAAIRS